MSITNHDKIMAALQDTVDAFNQDGDPNKAVAKVACDYGFNPALTKRLTETFNNARTVVHFENSKDKTASFDLAEIDKVYSIMHLPEKKEAEYDYNVWDKEYYRSYYNKDDIEHTPYVVKDAHAPEPTPTRINFADSAQMLEHLSNFTGMIKVSCEKIIDKGCNDFITKIRYATRGDTTQASTLVKTIKEACRREGINYAPKHLDYYLPDNFKENVTVKFAKVMNTSKYSDYLDILRVTDQALEKLAVANKVNEAIQAEIVNGEELRTKIAGLTDTEEAPTRTKKASISDFFDKEAASAVQESIDEVMSYPNQSDEAKDRSIRLYNIYRSLMLPEIMITDPVLSRQDSEDISKAYTDIVAIGDEAAGNRAVASSLLRQAVSGTEGTLSPYDASQLATLNYIMLRDPRKSNGNNDQLPQAPK